MNQAGTRLKQWQVTGAAWVLEQEKSTVSGGILAQTGCQQMLEQPSRACPQSEAAVLVRDRIAGTPLCSILLETPSISSH